MFKFGKTILVSIISLWIIMCWSFIAVEVLVLNPEVWLTFGIISASALVLLHGYFFFFYLKNKKKVEALKEEYITTLKPDKPLRFCPSDDELIKKHNEKQLGITQPIKTEEKTLATEEEQELE